MPSIIPDIICPIPIPPEAMPDIAQSLIDALGTLKPFQCSDYVKDVKEVLAVTEADFATPAPSQLYGEDPAGDSTVTQNFKVGTIALGVARSTAGHGFDDVINLGGAKALLEANAKALVIPIYRNFLEAHLEAATGHTFDLLALCNDPDFCESFVTKVFNPTFINNYLCAKIGGAIQYVQAIGYLFERARTCLQRCRSATPLPIPTCYATVQPTVSDIANSSLRDNTVFLAIVNDDENVKANPAQLQPFLNAASPFIWKGEDPLETPNFPAIGDLWSALWISDDYATQVATTLIDKESDSTTPGYSMGPVQMMGNVEVEYGKDLWNWMIEQQSSSAYENIFTLPAQNTNTQTIGPGDSFGCFSPGTLVETAEGSSEVQKLQSGAKILTKAKDEFGILSDETVLHDVTPKAVGRFERRHVLYGFNGEKPFVTAGHIFFTTAGPKAIKPAIAFEENSYVDVGHLQKGDVLLKLKSDTSGYDQIEIISIESGVADCKTVHGLHFAVGGGRYHANGYWVAENYPRLTMQSLLKRYNKLSAKNKVAFEQQVSKLSPTFRDVFGPCVFDQFKKAFGNTAQSRGKAKSLPVPEAEAGAPSPARLLITSERRGKQSLKRVTGQYHLINKPAIDQNKSDIDPSSPSFPSTVEKLNGPQQLPTIQVSEGKVLVDGKLAQHAAVHHSGIEWSHPISGDTNGMYQHGILRPIDAGTCLVGVVGTGPKNTQSTDDLANIQTVSAFLAPNSYSLVTSPQTYPSTTAADSASPGPGDIWTPFWRVTIGIAIVSGSLKVQVALPDLDTEYAKQGGFGTLYTVGIPATTNSMLTVTITVDPSMLQEVIGGWTTTNVAPGPVFSSITLLRDVQTNVMHGDYEPPVPADSESGNVSIYALAATDQGSGITAVKSAIQNALKAEPVLPSLMLAADVTNASSSVHLSPLPATIALSPLTLGDDALSPVDLMNTIVATPDDVQNLSQNYLTDAADFYRGPAEVRVFGSGRQTQDAIPETLQSGLPRDETEFLANYSRALIMQGLSTNDKYKSYFSKSDTDAMRYWFTGSDTHCLSQDPSFNSVSAQAARAAFISGNHHLQTYLDSPQDWALSLFKYLTQDSILNNAGVQAVCQGDAVLNNYCMLLDVLDNQDRNLSMQYIKLMRLNVGLQVSYGNIAVGSNFGAELQEIMAQIINIVIGQKDDPFYQLFSQDVQALQQEYNTDSGVEIAEQVFSDGQGVGLGIAWAMTSLSSRPNGKPKAPAKAPAVVAPGEVVEGGTRGCGSMFQKIKEKCTSPKALAVFGHLKTLLTLTVSAYSIYTTVKYLMDWKDLSPASRAQAVLAVISSTAQIWAGLRDIKDIITKVRAANPETIAGKSVFIELSQTIGQNGPPVAAVAEEEVEGDLGIRYLFPENVYEAVDPENGDTNEKFGRTTSDVKSAEKITQKFGLVEKVSAVINVALNISTCICIGLQIKNDFDRRAPIGVKILDIMNEVANSAQVITGIAETWMMVASVESAAIPVVGFAVAVLCIIIDFIEEFVHHDPPEDPVQMYLDEYKDSYISTLPQKPDPAFIYAVNPTQFSSSGPVTLTFSVTNTALTTQSNTTVNSIFFQFSVGSVKTNLLAAPTLADPTANTAASDLITYAITSGGDDFLISGPPTAVDSSNHISVKIQAKDSAGSAIPAAGLTFTITGTGNGVAGVAQVIVNESANNRPDKRVLPSTDVQETLSLSKV